MGIDADKYKALIRHVMDNFKALDTELCAYRIVFTALKSRFNDLDSSLEVVKTHPKIVEMMQSKYDVVEKLLKQLDEANQDQALLKWLQEWKPGGPTD